MVVAGVGRQEQGRRRDSFHVLPSGQGLGSGQTQAPHQDIVLPAEACHLPAAPPTSLREPRTLGGARCGAGGSDRESSQAYHLCCGCWWPQERGAQGPHGGRSGGGRWSSPPALTRMHTCSGVRAGPAPRWSCRWRQPLSHAICPRRRFSVSPQTRFSRCVHLSWVFYLLP